MSIRVGSFSVTAHGEGYDLLIDNRSQEPAIQCLTCSYVSYHSLDIRLRYCKVCHRFHEDHEIPTA